MIIPQNGSALRQDAAAIASEAIRSVLPDEAVARALKNREFGSGRLVLVAVGKAAWQMAKAASDILGSRLDRGIVITKYDHVKGNIPRVVCREGGHPVPDENGFAATEEAIGLVSGLSEEDTVLFLLSGGGSALFEKPLIPGEELAGITRQLLASGADIVEMNTVRKRLSAVKGGRFAGLCAPARVYAVVLSDIIGDPLDMIASGPACPDASTCGDAKAVAARYRLTLSPEAERLLETETPKSLPNVETVITGSVRNLCRAAEKACRARGYETVYLTDRLNGEAREAGAFLASIAASHQDTPVSLAYIAGGETVVHLKGKGRGGRNQEIALGAAAGLDGLDRTALFSLGSDGTDGPCDAAGGYVDDGTAGALRAKGIDLHAVLADNDAYPALDAVDGLIMTGPTGTNVNDVTVLLIRRS